MSEIFYLYKQRLRFKNCNPYCRWKGCVLKQKNPQPPATHVRLRNIFLFRLSMQILQPFYKNSISLFYLMSETRWLPLAWPGKFSLDGLRYWKHVCWEYRSQSQDHATSRDIWGFLERDWNRWPGEESFKSLKGVGPRSIGVPARKKLSMSSRGFDCLFWTLPMEP